MGGREPDRRGKDPEKLETKFIKFDGMDIQVEKDENWWHDLPEAVKAGIDESIQQADRGELIPFDDVKKEVAALLKT